MSETSEPSRALDIRFLKDEVSIVKTQQEAAELLYQTGNNVSAIEAATESLDLYLVIRGLAYIGDRTVPGEFAMISHGKFLCVLADVDIPEAVSDYLETYEL